MKTLNSIPTSRIQLQALAGEAVSGAIVLGPIINLQSNSAMVVGADYRTLFGDPNPPTGAPQIGKQGELNEAIAQHAIARQEAKAAAQAARTFAITSLRLLRNSFGAMLNSRWRDAGFTLKTLSVPTDPANVLLELRAYFRLHPAAESAEQNITAARADSLLTQLQDRRQVAAAKRVAEALARQARNEAQKALRRRLTGLRNELVQLLPKDDARWYEFGFKRPIDGRVPALVTGLELQRGLPHEVRAMWDAVPRALNYRVKWRLDVVGSTATEVGLFAERDVILRDLPSGTNIVVSITARNASGESAPTELSITVP